MANQPWSDDDSVHGRIVVVTDNPISQSILAIASTVERETVLLTDKPLDWFRANPLTVRDAVVFCDHDEPDAAQMRDLVLDGPASYVGMVGSRGRAAGVFEEYAARNTPAEKLARLQMPVGLNLGGRSGPEMALSIVAHIVATSYGRAGGPMKEPAT
ncbi:XdhC-like protein [Antricoccus suffuscus]|uniref:XdhC-like protein n=1 Tax=Antricoccus suffuscus TaxID=1629062 RepID=A0A2T1A313_9ACTN|nr:XdhC family protein [Antricoccus suffuscus]PRZ42976.1 XdhC-like protein [Antricoccus suffuscus]